MKKIKPVRALSVVSHGRIVPHLTFSRGDPVMAKYCAGFAKVIDVEIVPVAKKRSKKKS